MRFATRVALTVEGVTPLRWEDVVLRDGSVLWWGRVYPKRDEAMRKLVSVGWTVDRMYSDGVLRMTKDFAKSRGGQLAVFVGRDGRVTRPQSYQSLIEQAAIHEAGVTLRG